jgi:hypothetical protein
MKFRSLLLAGLVTLVSGALSGCCCDLFCKIPECDPCAKKCNPCDTCTPPCATPCGVPMAAPAPAPAPVAQPAPAGAACGAGGKACGK